MRLIDADELKRKMDVLLDDDWLGLTEYNAVTNAITNTPTVDAVEVVRCKDCKYYSVEGETTRFGWCGYWNKPTDEMRYCSDGERNRR